MKCPSCNTKLGNATSILASKIVERVNHECKNNGCKDLLPIAEYEEHLKVCEFRKVRCPVDGVACLNKDNMYESKQQVQFNKIEEHWDMCGNKWTTKNNSIWKVYENLLGGFQTKMFKAHGKIFFLKIREDFDSYFFETLMLGTEKESEEYLASILIFDKNMKIVVANSCHPKAMDLEDWGTLGLTLLKEDLKKIKLPHPVSNRSPPALCFKMKLSIDKL